MNTSDETNGTVSKRCYTWLPDVLESFNNITIEELNAAFLQRYIGGITLLSILILVGLVGNIHVFIVFWKKIKPSNYRISVLWLALLDIFNCAVVAPMVIAYHAQTLTYPSKLLCEIFRFVLYATAIASTSSLIVIAMDRYRRVCKTMEWQFSSTHAKLLCFASLVLAVLLSWPAPVLYGRVKTPTGIPGLYGYRCFTESHYDSKYQLYFNTVLIVYFVVVSTCLIFLYIKIWRHIKNHHEFRRSIRRMSLRPGEEGQMSTGAATRRTTYTLSAVTVAYILSAIPHHILVILIFVIPDFDCNLSLAGSQLYYTFIWSYFVNSVVNPFIYGIRDAKFRSHVKDLYTRKHRKGDAIAKMVLYAQQVNFDSRRTSRTSFDNESFDNGDAFNGHVCNSDINNGNIVNGNVFHEGGHNSTIANGDGVNGDVGSDVSSENIIRTRL